MATSYVLNEILRLNLPGSAGVCRIVMIFQVKTNNISCLNAKELLTRICLHCAYEVVGELSR